MKNLDSTTLLLLVSDEGGMSSFISYFIFSFLCEANFSVFKSLQNPKWFKHQCLNADFFPIFSFAEGLHVPGAVRGQGEGELWPWVRGRQCHNSEPPQRRKLEIPHHVEEQETRYVQHRKKTHTHFIPPVLLLFYVSSNVSKATVTVVDIDSGAEEKIVTTSQGSATGLNLKENQKIYFGGLPTIGNYRCKHTPVPHSYSHTDLYKGCTCDTGICVAFKV